MRKITVVIISALLVTILDIIIDPVTHMGKQWFLGEIYYYPEPGFYFDITLANFAGWFLVSLLINLVGVYILGFDKKCKTSRLNNLLALGLYFGIFGFGLCITIYLKQWLLLSVDLIWLMVVLALLFLPKRLNNK